MTLASIREAVKCERIAPIGKGAAAGQSTVKWLDQPPARSLLRSISGSTHGAFPVDTELRRFAAAIGIDTPPLSRVTVVNSLKRRELAHFW
jgi:hypothetical protein